MKSLTFYFLLASIASVRVLFGQSEKDDIPAEVTITKEAPESRYICKGQKAEEILYYKGFAIPNIYYSSSSTGHKIKIELKKHHFDHETFTFQVSFPNEPDKKYTLKMAGNNNQIIVTNPDQTKQTFVVLCYTAEIIFSCKNSDGTQEFLCGLYCGENAPFEKIYYFNPAEHYAHMNELKISKKDKGAYEVLFPKSGKTHLLEIVNDATGISGIHCKKPDGTIQKFTRID